MAKNRKLHDHVSSLRQENLELKAALDAAQRKGGVRSSEGTGPMNIVSGR